MMQDVRYYKDAEFMVMVNIYVSLRRDVSITFFFFFFFFFIFVEQNIYSKQTL